MSCHGCAKKYSLFNKEKECPNCGYSYCGSCLKFRTVVPKLGLKEQHVCRNCHSALLDVHAKSIRPEHPAASLQRLESLENPAKPPIILYQCDKKMQQLKRGLSQSETEIAERLEKLREGRKKERLPSVDEIASRLAVLKGENPASSPAHASNVLQPDLRSEQQQIDDLMNQYREEQELSLMHPTPVDEITNRLAKLRGVDANTKVESSRPMTVQDSSTPAEDNSFEEMPLNEANKLLKLLEKDTSTELQNTAHKCVQEVTATLGGIRKEQGGVKEDDEDSTSEVEQVVEKVLAQAALEEKLAMEELSDEPNSENDALPWCIICNEDAVVQCEGCDGDLYCKSCFKQGHIDEDLRDHKSIPYKPIKKSK